MDYQLDTKAAKQADQLFARIEEKGKYMGVITRAESIQSKKGTKGVGISFKTDTGSTADYLDFWTINNEGKQLAGYNLLMAIMTCLRVKGLTATTGEIEKYDRDTQSRVKVLADLFKELMGKPIGFLVHMEEYAKTDGGTAWKPVISAPFDHAGFTASEILAQAQKPETLEKMFFALRDRPLKNANSAPAQSHNSNSQSFDDLGDDIPF